MIGYKVSLIVKVKNRTKVLEKIGKKIKRGDFFFDNLEDYTEKLKNRKGQ